MDMGLGSPEFARLKRFTILLQCWCDKYLQRHRFSIAVPLQENDRLMNADAVCNVSQRSLLGGLNKNELRGGRK